MCTIQNTRPGYDSRNLTFEIDLIDSNVQIDDIEKEEEIINDLTKLFRIKNAPAMRANLDCSLGKDGLDQLAVQIGKTFIHILFNSRKIPLFWKKKINHIFFL